MKSERIGKTIKKINEKYGKQPIDTDDLFHLSLIKFFKERGFLTQKQLACFKKKPPSHSNYSDMDSYPDEVFHDEVQGPFW